MNFLRKKWNLKAIAIPLFTQKRALVRSLALLLLLTPLRAYTSIALSQNQIVFLKMSNVPLKEILNEVEKRTDCYFTYNIREIDANKRTSIDVRNKSVNEILDLIFSNTNISYIINENHITLFKTKDLDQTTPQKNKIVTGVVYEQSGEPMVGATVTKKGSIERVLTDIDGRFKLNATDKDILIFSYMGYITQEKPVGQNTTFRITLIEDNVMLENVVVTALGIKRAEKALSYNVQEVGAESVNTVKDANFLKSLSGKVAGVNINSSSAGTGSANRIIMRGVKSVEQNNNVLYVIDGIPMINNSLGGTSGIFASESGSESIADLNPDDIESLSVLNGPAASALYGHNAANGVIMITTKKGQIGKPKIIFSSQTTFSKPLLLPEFQNTYSNKPTNYESWGDKLEIPSSYKPKDFFNTGVITQNSLSLSVGTEKNQIYLSASFVNSDGIIPNSGYDRKNISFRNTTSFLNDKLTLDVGFNYILQSDRNMMAQGQYFNPLTAIYTFPRGENFEPVRSYERYNAARNIMTQFWPWGDQNLDMQNPYWITNRTLFEHDKKRYMFNAGAKYDISDWLNVIGRVRLDEGLTEHTRKLYATTNTLHTGGSSIDQDLGYYYMGNIKERQIYFDIIANMNKTVGDYNLNASLGGSFNNNLRTREGVGSRLANIPNFFAYTNLDRGNYIVPEQNGTEQETQSLFASVEAGWKNMLYLTLTQRVDWDSALEGTANKYYAYPSVGISGVISEMFKMPSFISYMKVRGSFAYVGNTIPTGLTKLVREFNPQTWKYENYKHRPLEKLKPERTRSWEAGLSTRMFENSLNLDVTFYQSNTYNQTIKVPLSATSGYNAMYVQTGNVQNKGIEGMLGYKKHWDNFSWNCSFTANCNFNKVIDLGRYTEEGEVVELKNIQKSAVGSAQIRLTTGGSLGDLWSTTRLQYDSNGNIWVNKDGMLTVENNYVKKRGSTLPKWNFGFNNSVSWKDLTFGFLVTARTGGVVLSATQAILDSFGVSEASARMRNNGGIRINNGTVDTKTWYQTIGGEEGVYQYYIYKANNVRLQELSLAYRLPSAWFNNRLKVDIAFIGQNLWLIYNKAPFDPESTPSTGNYYQGIDYFMQPSLRNLGFSVKVEF